VLDWAIVAFTLALALWGYRQGLIVGALGLRPLKLALGLVVGVAVGLTHLEPALVAGLTTAVYRTLAALIYRKRPLVRIMAEEVPAAELQYVVPFEARTKYVGADYVEQLAKLRGGTFARNPPDVGILQSLESLAATVSHLKHLLLVRDLRRLAGDY